ncbi:MAG: hypothetical protein RL211_189 [Pseudomonadota bacterium]|jgi:environmental stress-induced protein Ves
MTLSIVHAPSIAPQPWRNGGGQTLELLVWPPGPDWLVRISRADIESDGPFSAFPGVERWFTVLEGAGVALQFVDGDHILNFGDAPLAFDGAAAPGCRLLNGPTQDLNLMTRQGSGVMQPVQLQTAWCGPFLARGLYTLDAGEWQAGRQSRTLSAHTLLWAADGNADEWTFQPASTQHPLRAWWLGYTPS